MRSLDIGVASCLISHQEETPSLVARNRVTSTPRNRPRPTGHVKASQGLNNLRIPFHDLRTHGGRSPHLTTAWGEFPTRRRGPPTPLRMIESRPRCTGQELAGVAFRGGSNDLTQYLLAWTQQPTGADLTTTAPASAVKPCRTGARRPCRSKPVSICGEMAVIRAAVLLDGHGFDSLSMNAPTCEVKWMRARSTEQMPRSRRSDAHRQPASYPPLAAAGPENLGLARISSVCDKNLNRGGPSQASQLPHL